MTAAAYLVPGLLGMLLARIAIVDARQGIISNVDNLALAGLGALHRFVVGESLLEGASGGMIGVAVLGVGNLLCQRIRNRDGFGYGDVKFMAGAGLWTGPEGVAPMLLLASISGIAGFAMTGGCRGRARWESTLRFGPYLCSGLAVVLLLQWMGGAPWRPA